MQSLRDKARDLVSVAEGELQKREITIVALKRELVQVKEEMAAKKDPRLAGRSLRCENCAYRVIALKALDEEGAGKKADSIPEGV